MIREELMQVAKPILFNTEMVRAILDGRKTATRRCIKPRYREDEGGFQVCTNKATGEKWVEKQDWDEGSFDEPRYINPPYQPGDILYIRETWERFDCCSCEGDEHGNCPKEPKKSVLDKYGCGCYMYRASDEIWGDAKWHPSIHMPKEAARIFLKVTDVEVERLQNIDDDGVVAEGLEIGAAFDELWDSTIKKKDLDKYGWEANPWVWVIEFERVVEE